MTIASDDFNEEEGSGWSVSSDGNLSINTATTGTLGGGGSNCLPTTYPPSTYYYHHYPVYSSRKRCDYCDGIYCNTPEQCPRVKSVSYFKDGTISKIEFHNPEN